MTDGFEYENRCCKKLVFAVVIVSKETHSTGGGLGTTLLKYSPSGFMTHPRLWLSAVASFAP